MTYRFFNRVFQLDNKHNYLVHYLDSDYSNYSNPSCWAIGSILAVGFDSDSGFGSGSGFEADSAFGLLVDFGYPENQKFKDYNMYLQYF